MKVTKAHKSSVGYTDDEAGGRPENRGARGSDDEKWKRENVTQAPAATKRSRGRKTTERRGTKKMSDEAARQEARRRKTIK